MSLCPPRLLSRLGVVIPLALFALAPPPHRFSPPVDAPVVDAFRPPVHPYGPGNRGLDYATPPGATVRSIGDGIVVFAGTVARERYVTVEHPGGLRSSYSWLSQIEVTRGERVRRGQPIGRAGPRLQLGVRRGRTYLDPALLFERSRRARLVAHRLGSEPTARPD
jgi:murein DD-endopeptidase MepM/ murein hydrolase activator NlpD